MQPVIQPEEGSFAVRRMGRAETALIRAWASAEGWNPGLHDGECFFAADPGGFFVGEVDGAPVSCLSCVAYDDAFGFLGQYIVRPEVRGKGFGLQTWQAGMAHLGQRNVGLDGVLQQQGNYERSGFRFAYHHVRYQGEGGGSGDGGVVRLSEVPFEEVLAWDSTCFPVPRPTFLRGWLGLPEATALGVLRAGRLAGYGVLRRAVAGFKIGPLFAADPAVAEQLLAALLARAPGAPVCIDVPEQAAQPEAEALVGRFGMREVFRTARMYTKGPPDIRMDRIFAITTLELG